MVLKIKEAQEKYAEYIQHIEKLQSNIISAGFEIRKKDDFELGAYWDIFSNTNLVAEFEWNVPHYLIFEYLGDESVGFNIDYVKNLKEWDMLLQDVLATLSKS